MALEDLKAIEGGPCVPDAESAIIRGGADIVRVRGPREVGYAIGVPYEAVDKGEIGRGP